jgi:hypothetical protein
LPDLTRDQLAALAAAGASNREIETAHGRTMTDDERAAVDRAGDGIPHGPALGGYRLRIADAKRGYVPMNLADWIGHAPTPSEAVMFCRVYASLQAKGLLQRANLYGGGRRTSHLRLTDLGESTARNLLAMEGTR